MLGELPCCSFELSLPSTQTSLASLHATYDCPLSCLLLVPFRVTLGAQDIRKDTPGPELRREFNTRCCCREGRSLLRMADLVKITLVSRGLGGKPMSFRHERTPPAQALARMACGCCEWLRRLRSFTLYFDRKRRPCRSLAHWMDSSCKSRGGVRQSRFGKSRLRLR